jgi:hypothetical protein
MNRRQEFARNLAASIKVLAARIGCIICHLEFDGRELAREPCGEVADLDEWVVCEGGLEAFGEVCTDVNNDLRLRKPMRNHL